MTDTDPLAEFNAFLRKYPAARIRLSTMLDPLTVVCMEPMKGPIDHPAQVCLGSEAYRRVGEALQAAQDHRQATTGEGV